MIREADAGDDDRHVPQAVALHPGCGALRGTVVLPQPDDSVRVLVDAVVRWRDGRIVAVEHVAPHDPADDGAAGARVDAGRHRLIVPGLVDLHVHWPQHHVRGAFSGALLPWLRESIWPAEAAFVDGAVAEARARAFLHDLARAGTTAALTFGPPSLPASRTLLALAPRGIFDGPALMERNCPDELQTPTLAMLDAIAALPANERRRLAISPRFAPNVGGPGLAAAGALARRLGLPAQSHLSENVDEIRWVADLFPAARDYTDVYDQAGLLGSHVVQAHGVHLGDRELRRLAETGTWIAHCPTSNEALGSGRMPVERLDAAGVRWVLATDVGAGPQLSLLHVIDACVRHHAAAGVHVGWARALCRASAVPGSYLAQFDAGLDGLGTLRPGAPAHLLALPMPELPSATIMAAAAGDADAIATLLATTIAQAGPAFESAPMAVVQWGQLLTLPPDGGA